MLRILHGWVSTSLNAISLIAALPLRGVNAFFSYSLSSVSEVGPICASLIMAVMITTMRKFVFSLGACGTL